MEFNAGDCFILNPHGNDPHLYITFCGPSGEPLSIITAIVNTAYDEDNDVPVDNRTHNYILKPNVHSLVKVTSVVNYKSVQLLMVNPLKELEARTSWATCPESERKFRPHTPLDRDLLQGIVEGALASKATPKGMKFEIRRRLGIIE